MADNLKAIKDIISPHTKNASVMKDTLLSIDTNLKSSGKTSPALQTILSSIDQKLTGSIAAYANIEAFAQECQRQADKSAEAEKNQQHAEEGKRRAEQAQQQAEEDKRRAEQAQHQAEGEKRRAEHSQQQAQEGKRRAEQAQHQAEEGKQKAEGSKMEAELRHNAKIKALKQENDRQLNEKITSSNSSALSAIDKLKASHDAELAAKDVEHRKQIAAMEKQQNESSNALIDAVYDSSITRLYAQTNLYLAKHRELTEKRIEKLKERHTIALTEQTGRNVRLQNKFRDLEQRLVQVQRELDETKATLEQERNDHRDDFERYKTERTEAIVQAVQAKFDDARQEVADANERVIDARTESNRLRESRDLLRAEKKNWGDEFLKRSAEKDDELAEQRKAMNSKCGDLKSRTVTAEGITQKLQAQITVLESQKRDVEFENLRLRTQVTTEKQIETENVLSSMKTLLDQYKSAIVNPLKDVAGVSKNSNCSRTAVDAANANEEQQSLKFFGRREQNMPSDLARQQPLSLDVAKDLDPVETTSGVKGNSAALTDNYSHTHRNADFHQVGTTSDGKQALQVPNAVADWDEEVPTHHNDRQKHYQQQGSASELTEEPEFIQTSVEQTPEAVDISDQRLEDDDPVDGRRTTTLHVSVKRSRQTPVQTEVLEKKAEAILPPSKRVKSYPDDRSNSVEGRRRDYLGMTTRRSSRFVTPRASLYADTPAASPSCSMSSTFPSPTPVRAKNGSEERKDQVGAMKKTEMLWAMVEKPKDLTDSENEYVQSMIVRAFDGYSKPDLENIMKRVDKCIVGPMGREPALPRPCFLAAVMQRTPGDGGPSMTHGNCPFCRHEKSPICLAPSFAEGVDTGYPPRVGGKIPRAGRGWTLDDKIKTVSRDGRHIRWVLERRP